MTDPLSLAGGHTHCVKCCFHHEFEELFAKNYCKRYV